MKSSASLLPVSPDLDDLSVLSFLRFLSALRHSSINNKISNKNSTMIVVTIKPLKCMGLYERL